MAVLSQTLRRNDEDAKKSQGAPRSPELADLSPWDFLAALCRPVMVQLGPCPHDLVPSATEVPTLIMAFACIVAL